MALEIELSNSIWKQLNSAYGVPYDVSVPLIRLQETKDQQVIDEIWEELWNELHHQGDVSLASYLAVPQIVSICRNRNLFDWNPLSLCSVIEQQRIMGNNPELPEEFRAYYFSGISDLRTFAISNLTEGLDRTTLIIALSTIATCNGEIKVGKAILELEDEDLLKDFLEQF